MRLRSCPRRIRRSHGRFGLIVRFESMKTWEEFQANRPVGRIRHRLAQLLSEAIPGLVIDGCDLQPQNPAFSRPEVDCCTWDAWGVIHKDYGHRRVHLYSWQSMGECVKAGRLSVRETSPFDYDVGPYEEPIRGKTLVKIFEPTPSASSVLPESSLPAL